jgi:hypothetical protein
LLLLLLKLVLVLQVRRRLVLLERCEMVRRYVGLDVVVMGHLASGRGLPCPVHSASWYCHHDILVLVMTPVVGEKKRKNNNEKI